MNLGIYKKVEILDKTKDKSLRVNLIKDYEYAKELTNSPITIGEFTEAKNSLPIVFIKNDDEYGAIVILGLNSKNKFVEENNSWKSNSYIPAFVRRYPFVFATVKDKLALALDKDCSSINKKSGQSLFTKEGEPTQYTTNVMEFMESYQKDAKLTSQIAKELDDLGVLEEAQLNIGSGKEAKIFNGFKRVNEEKLNALSNEVLSNMVRNGGYKIILAHLESLANFKTLAI